MTTPKTTLTTGEAARYCGVNFRTIIRWIEKGRLKAYKLPGRGDHRIQISDFIVFLQENEIPVPAELDQAPSAFTSRPSGHLCDKQRILVIDDDPAMAKAIKRTLHRQNYQVETVLNSFEAGMAIIEHQPDLVTLDLSMPGMDGFAVLEFIRTHCPNSFKIIVISALPKLDLDRAIELGADAALSKPFEPDQLCAQIAHLMMNE